MLSMNDRQMSLRRADWRFLLPRPSGGSFEHLVLLGGPANLAECIVENGIARHVSHDPAKAWSTDALVILADSVVTLRDAVGCLKAGGALYYEVDRRVRPARGELPGKICRLMRDVGLTQMRVYWAKPDLARCEMYLPLDASGALGWYLRTLYMADTPAKRVAEPVLHALTRFGRRPFASLMPCYTITAVAGVSHQATSAPFDIPALHETFCQADIHPLVLLGGIDERSRIIILPFGPKDKEPAMVLKVSRRPEFDAHTVREQAILAEILARVSQATSRAIPRPLALLRDGGLAISAETYIPGKRLAASSGHQWAPLGRQLTDLRIVAAWLGEFHQETEIDRPLWNDQTIADWIEKPLADYEREFGTTAREDHLFAVVRTYARGITGVPFPIVWRHHDLNEWNVCCTNSVPGIIDWERARIGPALCDLLYLVTHWSIVARHLRSDEERGGDFRALFLVCGKSDDARVTLVWEVIARYMAHLRLDRRFFPLLLTVTWVEHALGHCERLRALHEAGAREEDSRASNQWIKYVGLIGDHVEDLFARTTGVIPCGS